MKFSCTELTQNLYILGGFIIFFSYLSRLSVGFLLFFLFQCAFHSRFATQCRRKNSSAKSKQGKIEDMHSWRCFPLGAIHKWRHQFFLNLFQRTVLEFASLYNEWQNETALLRMKLRARARTKPSWFGCCLMPAGWVCLSISKESNSRTAL